MWDFLKPSTEGQSEGPGGQPVMEEDVPVSKKTNRWASLKAKSTLTPIGGKASSKWTPAIGRYCFLNKIWIPVHKIQFLDPTPQPTVSIGAGGHRPSDEVPFLRVLITALDVTDRPDLMVFQRKGSTTMDGGSITKGYSKSKGSAGSDGGDSGSEGGRGSVSSVDMLRTDDDLPLPDPTNMALPTMLMAGTIIGTIFRADLSKVKVDVETNNLCKFYKTGHQFLHFLQNFTTLCKSRAAT